MALPSLTDLVFIIVILIPGFLALTLFRWLAILEKEISDYQLGVWSLFFSLLIFVIFGWHTGITDVDAIRDNLLSPTYLAEILTIGLALGVVPGLIARLTFRKGFIRGDPWEASMKLAGKEGCWVIIYTDDGREYMGYLHYSGTSGDEFPREISIRNPTVILRDCEWKIKKEIECGKEVLFSEDDVRRIVFYEEV